MPTATFPRTVLRHPVAASLLVLAGAFAICVGLGWWSGWLDSVAGWLFILSAAVPISVIVLGAAGNLFWLKLAAAPLPRGRGGEVSEARVDVLLCTADDFEEDAALAAAQQDLPGARLVILDDSRAPASRERIDRFAAQHRVSVVRRTDRSGFKAGNLNSYLAGGTDAAHIIVVDADQHLPAGFARRALRAIEADPAIAVVQGAVRTRRAASSFAAEFGGMLDAYLNTVERGRAAAGSAQFLGRGAILRVAALHDVGGFPAIVMEDMALGLRLRARGWRIERDARLVSFESYPPDAVAFRKQFAKFTEGSTELLVRQLRGPGPRNPAHRIDALLQCALPVAAAALTIITFAGAMVAPLPPVLLAVPALCGIVAVLPETVRRWRQQGILAAARFAALAVLLYTSMAIVTVRAAFRVGLGGRARFAITPKRSARGGALIREVLPELAIASAAVGVAIAVSGDVRPAMGMVGAASIGACWVLAGLRPTTRVADEELSPAR
ncbi:MAG TPA: glycosyltransferase family 2 protein [Rhodoglobus sp.]|nr:glycosyltransferase family 2 protein [Rhodoglobus sp.]